MDQEIVNLFSILSSFAAGGGLVYTAITFHGESKARQVQMAECIFRDIRGLERELASLPEENISKWDSLFFNTLEWFAFLINERKIKDKKIISFFESAIVSWYDNIFLVHYNKGEIEDTNIFPELKKLYHAIKRH